MWELDAGQRCKSQRVVFGSAPAYSMQGAPSFSYDQQPHLSISPLQSSHLSRYLTLEALVHVYLSSQSVKRHIRYVLGCTVPTATLPKTRGPTSPNRSALPLRPSAKTADHGS